MSSSPPLSTSEDAGAVVEQGKPRVFPCEACGADLSFSIEQQNLECPFCGHVKKLEFAIGAEIREQDLREALDNVANHRAGHVDRTGIREVRCGDCGAQVQFKGTLTSQLCPYCASPMQVAGAHEVGDRIPVDGVLPFRVDHDKAKQNLVQWVKSRWFAPNDFLEQGVQGRFSGVYMPYWTYDALTMNRWSGERGEHYFVTVKRGDKQVREMRTRWYHVSGDFRRFFDDVLVVAGTGLPGSIVRSLEPWPLHHCVPFTPDVLAGYLARTYDVPLAEGFAEAEKRIEAALRDDVRQRIGGDAQRIHSINTTYGAMTYKHVLLPVWMLAYRYKEKVYQVIVNAATGEVQGERPYSWIKITLFVLLLVAVGGVAYWLYGR